MRRYRKERKVSQDALARLANVSVSAVSQIERGIHGASRETAEALDRALGAGGELLVAFGYTNEPPAPTDDVAEVLELARSMREGLTKSQSRDAKLDEIIGLCEDISHHIAELTVTAVEARASAARNEAVIAALAEHFALVVDLSQA